VRKILKADAAGLGAIVSELEECPGVSPDYGLGGRSMRMLSRDFGLKPRAFACRSCTSLDCFKMLMKLFLRLQKREQAASSLKLKSAAGFSA
jgi:hypothetical protein